MHRYLLRPSYLDRPGLWAGADYGWLATAVVGVVFATGEIHRLGQAEGLADARSQVESAYRDVVLLSRYNYELHSQHSDSTPTGRWFRELWRVVQLGWESQEWRHFLYQNDNLIPHLPHDSGVRPSVVPQFPTIAYERLNASARDMDIDTAKDVVSRLLVLDSAVARYNGRAQAESRSDLERGLRIAFPWLLVIAIALRVTKVTRDWKAASARFKSAP
jgi:hypothetical protein